MISRQRQFEFSHRLQKFWNCCAVVQAVRSARMSGSGATCFGLFVSLSAARGAAGSLRAANPGWWVRVTTLG